MVTYLMFRQEMRGEKQKEEKKPGHNHLHVHVLARHRLDMAEEGE